MNKCDVNRSEISLTMCFRRKNFSNISHRVEKWPNAQDCQLVMGFQWKYSGHLLRTLWTVSNWTYITSYRDSQKTLLREIDWSQVDKSYWKRILKSLSNCFSRVEFQNSWNNEWNSLEKWRKLWRVASWHARINILILILYLRLLMLIMVTNTEYFFDRQDRHTRLLLNQ